MGYTIITTIEANAEDIAIRNRGRFDRVLLDAPCSNTGVLRRRVEARWRLGDKPLATLVKAQSQLLRAALQALKPDGVLVYSTCSMEPEENETLVAKVLRLERGFVLDAQERMLPHRDGGDGHFMARIRCASVGKSS